MNGKRLESLGMEASMKLIRDILKKRQILMAMFCIVLAAICIARGRSWSKEGECLFQSLTIQSEEESFSGEWLQSALGENDLTGGTESENADSGAEEGSAGTKRSFAAWKEWKGETIVGNSSGRSENASVIAVCGPSHCLLPIGKNLMPQDKNACIIGQKMAKKLFGGFQAEGQKIIWQDETWTVRGVVKEPASLLMVQVGGLPKLIERLQLNRINIALKEGEDRQLAGESFILQNNLSAKALRWDFLHGFSWFSEMVPGEWSDFEGWKQNFQKHREATRLAENTWKSSIEAWGLDCRKRGGGLSLAGGFLLVAGLAFFVTTVPKYYVNRKSM